MKKDTVKVNVSFSKMVAHRGVSGLERENTNAAFVAAGQRSYYGIETDVYRTADGHIVCIHDGNLERVAGVNLRMGDATLEQIQAVSMFDHDGKKRSDLIVPTLDEYIRICAHYRKIGVLELKDAFTEEEICKIVDIIKEEGYLENIIFISFNWDNLILLKKNYPDQPAQFLTGEITDELIAKLVENKLDIDAHFSYLTEDNIKKMHDAGITINCWTVDNPEDAERLDKWGVDQITSNILE